MTDTIEAVALNLRADLDEATKQHMPAMVVTTNYLRTVLDTIAALKAEIERLTTVNTPCGPETHEKAVGWHLPTMLRWIDENRAATHMPSGDLVGTVLRIAAERIERLTEREAQAKLDGVRAGIEAAAAVVEAIDARPDFVPDSFYDGTGAAYDAIRALDAEAIAKGEG